MKPETKESLLDVVRVAIYDMLGVAFKAMPLEQPFYTSWSFSPQKGFLQKKEAVCFEIARIDESRWTLSVLHASKSLFSTVSNKKELLRHIVDTRNLIGTIMGIEETLAQASYPQGQKGGLNPFGFLDFIKESKERYPQDHILHHIHFIFEQTNIFEKLEMYRQREARDARRSPSSPSPV